MTVADLGLSAAEHCLRHEGLRLRIGPIAVSIRSSLALVQRGVLLHYAQHAVEPSDGFVDFHVCIDRARSRGLWPGRGAAFRFDGRESLARTPDIEGFALLERGLHWCISNHCHQYLIVRAAVLERSGRALLLPAPAGSGKSTLCAGLVFGGGWRLLSDELALIDPTNGTVLPLPRPLDLKDESIDSVRGFAPTAVFGDVVFGTDKRRMTHVQPPADAVLRANEAALPAWVVMPCFEAGTSAQLQPLSRARAFMALVDNAFNYNVHGRGGFAAFADVIDRSDCYKLNYCSLAEAVAVFDQLARANS